MKRRARVWDHNRGREQEAVHLARSLKSVGTKVRSAGADFVSPAQQDGQLI